MKFICRLLGHHTWTRVHSVVIGPLRICDWCGRTEVLTTTANGNEWRWLHHD